MNPVSSRFFTAMTNNQVNNENEKKTLLKDSIEFVKEFFQLPSAINDVANFITLCLAIKDEKIIDYDAVKFKVEINNNGKQNTKDKCLVINCFNKDDFNKLTEIINKYKEPIYKLSQSKKLFNNNTLTRGYTHLLAIGVFIFLNNELKVKFDIDPDSPINKNYLNSVFYISPANVNQSSQNFGIKELIDYIIILFNNFDIYDEKNKISTVENYYLLHEDYLNIIKEVITSEDVKNMLRSINSYQGTNVIKKELVNNDKEYFWTRF